MADKQSSRDDARSPGVRIDKSHEIRDHPWAMTEGSKFSTVK
jgi:hypothetical protein